MVQANALVEQGVAVPCVEIDDVTQMTEKTIVEDKEFWVGMPLVALRVGMERLCYIVWEHECDAEEDEKST
jgi:hypothetical protein